MPARCALLRSRKSFVCALPGLRVLMGFGAFLGLIRRSIRTLSQNEDVSSFKTFRFVAVYALFLLVLMLRYSLRFIVFLFGGSCRHVSSFLRLLVLSGSCIVAVVVNSLCKVLQGGIFCVTYT